MALNTTGQTITGNQPGFDTPRNKFGQIVFDATAITAADSVVVFVGFTPKYVQWINTTDRVGGEWREGMAANSCLKTVAAGTRTLEVTGGNGGITICDVDGTANTLGRYFAVLQNATLALVVLSTTAHWEAR